MTKYARGDRAWGHCARSGRRMLLKDMVEDPRTGTLVDPSWAEPPDPRPRRDLQDGIALRRPTGNLDRIGTTIVIDSQFNISTGNSPAKLWALVETGKGTAEAV